MAAQAHSPKADRAVVISSRNFLRSLGGACGLAIASALYSNTLVDKLPSPPALPADVADRIKSSVFSVPDLSGLSEEQKNMVLDTYTLASRSVFYFWVGCISCCWLLMFFIKDKGLQRKEEMSEPGPKPEPEQEAEGRIRDEEGGGSTPTSGEEELEEGSVGDREKRTTAWTSSDVERRGTVDGGNPPSSKAQAG